MVQASHKKHYNEYNALQVQKTALENIEKEQEYL